MCSQARIQMICVLWMDALANGCISQIFPLLEKLRFTFACSILSCLGLHSHWCSVYKTWPVGGIGQIEWHIIVVLLIHGIVDSLMHGISVKALERAFALEPHSVRLDVEQIKMHVQAIFKAEGHNIQED